MAASNALPSPLPPSRVSSETVGRAVDALLKWLQSKAKNEKAQLLDHDELLYLVLTLKKIPPTARTNPYKIPLPHPLFQSPSLEICLILDDSPKSPLSTDAAKKKIQSESIPISKVLKLSKLKSDYRPFEAKRQLCGSYDLFFADKRVVPLLPRLLGKHFFKKKKIPIPIDLRHKSWKEQIRLASGSTLLYLRTGTCCILKVAWESQDRDEIVENVLAAIHGAVELVPKKWGNIRSFHLKSVESVALPLYQAVPEMGLKIEGYKEEEEDGEKNGAKMVGSEDGIKEEKKSVKKKVSGKKKVPKKGRIHEVRYMDSNLEESMANMVDDGESIGADELGGVEPTEKKKKKKKRKTVIVGLPKKSAKMIDDDGKANEADDLGAVKTTGKRRMAKKESGGDKTMEKRKMTAKKKPATGVLPKKSTDRVDGDDKVNESEKKKITNKKKTSTGELTNKSAKLMKVRTLELKNGSTDADGMNDKKKKRIKAEEAEGKEKKIKKNESKRRRGVE